MTLTEELEQLDKDLTNYVLTGIYPLEPISVLRAVVGEAKDWSVFYAEDQPIDYRIDLVKMYNIAMIYAARKVLQRVRECLGGLDLQRKYDAEEAKKYKDATKL